MRGIQRLLLCVLAVCFLLALPAWAGKFKPEDFPLQVHIVERNGVRHYYHGGYCGGGASLDQVDGLGAANLIENGQPLGFDYDYCSDRRGASGGWEQRRDLCFFAAQGYN